MKTENYSQRKDKSAVRSNHAVVAKIIWRQSGVADTGGGSAHEKMLIHEGINYDLLSLKSLAWPHSLVNKVLGVQKRNKSCT